MLLINFKITILNRVKSIYLKWITSPPYFDLEIYSDEDTQSVNQYPNYLDWLTKFIEPIIKFISNTESIKYSCWSVINFGKYKFLDDIIKIHNGYKWIKEDIVFKVVGNNRINGKKMEGEVTMVFKKNKCY